MGSDELVISAAAGEASQSDHTVEPPRDVVRHRALLRQAGFAETVEEALQL